MPPPQCSVPVTDGDWYTSARVVQWCLVEVLAAIVYKVSVGRYSPDLGVRMIELAYLRKQNGQLMTPSAAHFLQKILQEYKGGKVDGKGKGVDGKGLVYGKGLDGKGKGVVDGKGLADSKVRHGRATKLFKDIRAAKASRASSMAVQKIVIWTPFKNEWYCMHFWRLDLIVMR